MAEDYVYKRQKLALELVDLSKKIVDSINRLNEIQLEVAESGGGFEDSDFTQTPVGNIPNSLSHLNAWKTNNLVNDVAPNLDVALDGTLEASTTTYEQILLAVKL